MPSSRPVSTKRKGLLISSAYNSSMHARGQTASLISDLGDGNPMSGNRFECFSGEETGSNSQACKPGQPWISSIDLAILPQKMSA